MKFNKDYKSAVHMLRPKNVHGCYNYFCYNGSAHLNYTKDILKVNCQKCINKYLEENNVII